MFYGSGAGKLPTASAVVADVVDAAKHLDETIMAGWTEEKQQLCDKNSMKRRFFVRVKGDKAEADKYAAVFGPVEIVDAGVEGEFGFETGVMTEGEYLEKAAKSDAIIKMIRIEG
jgi:homoserine dehydrogenase